MSKRTINNLILLVIVTVYIIIYKIIIFPKFLRYSDTITACTMMVILFLSIILLGFRKNKKSPLKKCLTIVTVTQVLLFFALSYGLGLITSFLKNSYLLTFSGIINNIFAPTILIICTEIFRYNIISANKDKKSIIILTTLLLMTLEIVISIKGSDFYSTIQAFRTITSVILPIISKNLLMSYLVYYGGYKPTLIYRIIMDLYIYIMPIVPNLGNYLESMVGICLPIIIFIMTSRTIDEYTNEVEYDFSKSIFKLSDFPTLIILSVLVGLVSGILPFHLIGIGSESMAPKLRKGDGVILKKVTKKEELKVGDIISFQGSPTLTVHRIIDIKKENGKYIYHTKGDANNTKDIYDIEFADIKGKVVVRIPYIAYPSVYISEIFGEG